MGTNIVSWNVVIAASFFNPSVVSQYWLIKNGILDEADFQPGCIFSQGLTQVLSSKVALVVAPESLQVFPQCQAADSESILNDSAVKIVRLLEHTPYSAVGINFIYDVTPNDADVGTTTRTLFSGKSKIYANFTDDNVRLGTYLSKDVDGARLRLDIKPVKDPSSNREDIRLVFNFSKDLVSDNKPDAIAALIGKWGEYLAMADRMSDEVDKRSLS